MGKLKKYAFLILVFFLVLGTSVGRTLAYLTDTDISISKFDVLTSEPSEAAEVSTENSESTKSSEPTITTDPAESSVPTDTTEPTESIEPEESATGSEEPASEVPGPEA